MAKFEGTQEIPSELFVKYRGALTLGMPTKVIRKRFPWRLPAFQKGGYKITDEQLEQRSRFEAIRDKFKTLSDAERTKWYDAMPEWGSLLWYYNYFMLSGLMGNAVVGDKGGGVIKDINHYTFTMLGGAPANITVNIDTCDPGKAVAFLFGNGANVQNPEAGVYYAVPVYPYLVTLASTYAVFKASMFLDWDAGCSVSIIEYI